MSGLVCCQVNWPFVVKVTTVGKLMTLLGGLRDVAQEPTSVVARPAPPPPPPHRRRRHRRHHHHRAGGWWIDPDAVVEQDGEAAAARGDDIQQAIAVEVGRRDGHRAGAGREQQAGGEGAVAGARQDADALAPPVVTTSVLPSPLKSPTATEVMAKPESNEPAVLNEPSPLPVRTVTRPPERPATMSGLPSPLRSPTATETAGPPTPKLRSPWKVPLPLPSSSLTVPSFVLAVRMSRWPSWFMSARATADGRLPTWSTRGPLLILKWPVPSLKRTTTVLPTVPWVWIPWSVIAMSGLPSPLRSPTAMADRLVPTKPPSLRRTCRRRCCGRRT